MVLFFGLGAAVFFCFLALGGVFERCELLASESGSEAEPSSSVSGFGRFFETRDLVLVVNLVCDILGAVLLAAVFALAAVAALALLCAFGF